MEELQSALNAHMDQMADLVEKLTGELRSGLKPAYENFMGFFHAIDWKEPWLICLISFHVVLLLVAFMSRKNINFQMCLFLLALGGVYLAERLNHYLAGNWRSFAGQNYFDRNGLFLSVLWSGPLLVIAIIILVNTLFSLCHLIVRWKKAELRHRARVAQKKEE
ncbi:transmembrane protein 18 [Sesamum indicum]|uniref:Transmembrane protein 18 n=1 Tax=Sesamum indicum TaxID=4182 RepID=A0A6I9SWA1_SESIN|nr:transmembrane protein 18 [Sesamum indicum]